MKVVNIRHVQEKQNVHLPMTTVLIVTWSFVYGRWWSIRSCGVWLTGEIDGARSRPIVRSSLIVVYVYIYTCIGVSGNLVHLCCLFYSFATSSTMLQLHMFTSERRCVGCVHLPGQNLTTEISTGIYSDRCSTVYSTNVWEVITQHPGIPIYTSEVAGK